MQLTIADLAETYATRAARVGVRTIHASMSDVPGAILEVAGAVGAASVAVAGNVPERGAILAAAAGRGLRLVEPAEISPVDRADLGVSVARMMPSKTVNGPHHASVVVVNVCCRRTADAPQSTATGRGIRVASRRSAG